MIIDQVTCESHFRSFQRNPISCFKAPLRNTFIFLLLDRDAKRMFSLILAKHHVESVSCDHESIIIMSVCTNFLSNFLFN